MQIQTTDTKTVSQNETVPVYHSSKQIETTDRFFLETLTSVNYDTYTAIYELLDNSKDASATRIDVIYDKKTATLIIQDNGHGMSLRQICNNMDFGCDKTYENHHIGYFGMGMKTSTLNLLNSENELPENSVIEIITNDGEEKTKIIWKPFIQVRKFDTYVLPKDSEIGTTVIVNNCVNFHSSVLKKNLGVVFYPTLKYGNLKIYVNEEEVIATDPLYRNSEKTIFNEVETTIKKETIKITAVSIDVLEVKTPWDDKKVKEDDEKAKNDGDDGGWSFKKYGCYVIYGGRYIELGGSTLGTRLFDSWYNRCRIEFTIPKDLTTYFNINFNKTYGLKLKKEKTPDLFRVIGLLFTWGRAQRNIESKQKKMVLSAEQEMENYEIAKAVNKSAVNAGFIAPKTEEEKVKVSFVANPNKKPKDDSKESTNRKAKVVDKKLYEFRFEPFESTSVFWKLSYENNRFVICINTTHIFYRRIYLNLPKESKLGFQQLLASMAHTQYRIDEYGVNSDDEFFWDTYWSHVSLDLAKIMNN